MKRFLFIMLLIAWINVYGQTKSEYFSLSSTIGTGVAINSPSKVPFLWELSGYYHINQRLSTGIGTGISVYEKALLPIFADIKFKLTRLHLITPYLRCAAGYSFTLSPDSNGGIYLSPDIGIEINAHKRFRILAAIGYQLQKLERLKIYENEYLSTEFKESLSHNTLTFKIGIVY